MEYTGRAVTRAPRHQQELLLQKPVRRREGLPKGTLSWPPGAAVHSPPPTGRTYKEESLGKEDLRMHRRKSDLHVRAGGSRQIDLQRRRGEGYSELGRFARDPHTGVIAWQDGQRVQKAYSATDLWCGGGISISGSVLTRKPES